MNFFASWCAPCRSEAPQLTRVREFGTRVQVLAVAQRRHPLGGNTVRPPVRLDVADRLGRLRPLAYRYGLIGQPTTFVIDQQGRIAWSHQGKVQDGALADVLQALL